MVYFVGAGSGAPDLITVRGAERLMLADVVIYAGSLGNPALLDYANPNCVIYNSAEMTLEQVIDVIKKAETAGRITVRLHTGDPSLYGAVREQMDRLDALGISYESVPGVPSFCGAAAALNAEYTLPDVSQSVVITRMAGRTPVPDRESIRSFARHGCTMVIFLSSGLTESLQQELTAGGFPPDTPAAIVYKATWPDEKILRCTIGTIHKTMTKTDKKYGPDTGRRLSRRRIPALKAI
jgi:precorrin-4/cobalt-precorrin-4 C11-methyltransferase